MGGGAISTVELEVGGMHCASCAALIEESLAEHPAVHRVAVDVGAARASVDFDAGTLSVGQLCAAVAAAGYSAIPLRPIDAGS